MLIGWPALPAPSPVIFRNSTSPVAEVFTAVPPLVLTSKVSVAACATVSGPVKLPAEKVGSAPPALIEMTQLSLTDRPCAWLVSTPGEAEETDAACQT